MQTTLPSNFEAQLSSYLEHIKTSYRTWNRSGNAEIINQMIAEFETGVSVERGSKYLKVVSRGSVHSFIVIKGDGKFKVGDILKAATFKAPATNFNRGNILTGDFSRVTWTGAI
jgi:hypothetical protein